ncbi:hypothetical protein AV521_44790 [Streptomyces sp. IMTB 2501]|nr:hypothetical protein AV521_44790 [Streptomyces sp. IMTB 2501]
MFWPSTSGADTGPRDRLRRELHTVITVQFTVRPGQGDASGFDLGDMTVTGDLGTADSAGHVPDQGMMIYLSVVQLLDSLGDFLRGNARVAP